MIKPEFKVNVFKLFVKSHLRAVQAPSALALSYLISNSHLLISVVIHKPKTFAALVDTNISLFPFVVVDGLETAKKVIINHFVT